MGKDESADLSPNNENKKKKKKKKKAGQSRSAGSEENREGSKQGQILPQAPSVIKEIEDSPQCSQAEDLEKEAEAQSSISSVKVTEAAIPQDQSKTLFLSEAKKEQLVTVRKEASHPKPRTTDNKDQSETFSKKKKKRDTSEPKPEITEEQQTPATTKPEMLPEASAPVSGKKKKKSLKAELQTDVTEAQSQFNPEAEITSVSCEASGGETMTAAPKTDAAISAKKKKKGTKAERKPEGSEGESQIYGVNLEEDATSICCEDSAEDDTITRLNKPTDGVISAKKKSKKKSLEADVQVEIQGRNTDTKITPEASQHTMVVPLKKKTKKKGKEKLEQTLEAPPAADETTVTPLKNKRKKNKKESKIIAEEEQAAEETRQVVNDEKLLFQVTMTTPKKREKTPKRESPETTEIKDETQLQVVGSVNAELPLDETEVVSSSRKPTKKKKRKIPVVFEYEADELEAAAQEDALISGLAEEIVAKKTKLGNVSM